MKNCLNIRNLAIFSFLTVSFTFAGAQTTAPAKDAATQSTGTPKFFVTASGEKIPLTSGVEKRVGKIQYLNGPTIIDNRIDSNAILNLDAKPLAAKAADAPAPEAPKKVAEEAKPVARDLAAELNAARKQYADARIQLKAAQKAKDQTATVTARHDIAAAKSEIDDLKREIASASKKAKAK
jgi:hypothetical protein